MPRQSLGELELLVMLALLRLGAAAYGAAIRAEIRARVGRDVTPGAIYPTLARLEDRGLVKSVASDPLPERGGRSRRVFELRPQGLKELRRTWRQYAVLAHGLEPALDPERALGAKKP
ncbi:MAG TPA: PadR family transcriptional regulator [Vicinamibacterales bacterium]|nr:PadR family transcriptional regulator [Vicinamibacterales bacterium]